MIANRTKTGRTNIIGYNIAIIRKKLGISQRELAERLWHLGLDIDKNAIQRMESGQRLITEKQGRKKHEEWLNALRSFNTRHG